jgi:hypothetical protein
MSGEAMRRHDLKSFSKDWARWSDGERMSAKMALVATILAIIGPLALGIS